MSGKSLKSSKITEFFSPKPNSDKMEGTKSKKRPIENDARAQTKMSPKKAKGDKRPKDDDEKKRKRRTKKDTGVKRSCSAYIYFTKSFREELKAKALKDNTTVPKANEVAKLAGERWKTLSATERKPFEDLAAKDKARYLKECGEMKNSQEKDPNPKPKRPPTAYFIFLKEFRKQMEGKVSEGNKIPALAGEKWREMSEEDKVPYKTKEAAAKKEHTKALVEWQKRQKELGLDKVEGKKSSKAAAQAQKKSKPKKKVEVVEEVEEDDEDEEEEEDEEDEEEEEDDDEDEEDDDDDDDDDDE